jgi:thiamine transport system permease protein
MARRAVAMILPVAVILALAMIVALVLLPLLTLIRGGFGLSLQDGDLQMLGFTLWQAFLSALFSVGLAIPLARALWRTHFRFRGALVDALTAPLLFPVIVVVVAMAASYGRNGPVNQMLRLLGLPEVTLFGLQGILLAHIFLNLPLALRMLLTGWAQVPAEHGMLAASLRLSAWDRFKAVEFPMLRRVVPQAFAAIFLVCLTSFTVVLTLGGGPKNTSLELGIYQALRFDFQPERAALLALLQLAIGGGAALLLVAFGGGEARGGLDRAGPPFHGQVRVLDVGVLIFGTLVLIAPMVLLLPGLLAIPTLPNAVWPGALRAVMIGLGSATVTVALGLPLALWIGMRRPGSGIVNAIGTLPRAASPLALATGLYLVATPYVSVTAWSLSLAALVTGLLLVPFFLRLVIPQVRESHDRFHRLAANLRLSPAQQIWQVHLPRARREIAEGAGLAAALAAGEMAVLALFTDPARVSLPLQVQGLLGAYRVDQAMGAALVLTALALVMYAGIARLGGRKRA